ncbi:hypothetical protein [Limnospira platensis]|uniref:hypothetical protein n=2 Tax=Limnospira platensis TaxID=118562 RepID=UPI00396C65A8
MALGNTLDECARKYRGFCKKYKPKPKSEKRYHWGSKFLPKVIKGSGKKPSPGQMKLPWNIPDREDPDMVTEVAAKFVQANGYRPEWEWEVPGIE